MADLSKLAHHLSSLTVLEAAELVRLLEEKWQSAQSGTHNPAYDEASDIALMRELMFDPQNVVLESYSAAELKSGKTPDFKLFKGGKLCGFCEVKSPRDDVILEHPKEGEFAVREDLPFHRKLGQHIRDAGRQLDAVNPDHSLLNIVVFVNHSPDIKRGDLHLAVTGLSLPEDKRIFMLPPTLQKQVHDAAGKVDLFFWIDAEKRTFQHVSVNGATHQKAALDLFGLPQGDPPTAA